jgi:hypothetical protein
VKARIRLPAERGRAAVGMFLFHYFPNLSYDS